MADKHSNSTNLKALSSYLGLLCIFAGIVWAGTAYLYHWDTVYIWLGGGVVVLGLILIASLEVWLEALVPFIKGTS